MHLLKMFATNVLVSRSSGKHFTDQLETYEKYSGIMADFRGIFRSIFGANGNGLENVTKIRRNRVEKSHELAATRRPRRVQLIMNTGAVSFTSRPSSSTTSCFSNHSLYSVTAMPRQAPKNNLLATSSRLRRRRNAI